VSRYTDTCRQQSRKTVGIPACNQIETESRPIQTDKAYRHTNTWSKWLWRQTKVDLERQTGSQVDSEPYRHVRRRRPWTQTMPCRQTEEHARRQCQKIPTSCLRTWCYFIYLRPKINNEIVDPPSFVTSTTRCRGVQRGVRTVRRPRASTMGGIQEASFRYKSCR